MTKFIQIHSIVSYGPSNLNRDDAGRPKSCILGGIERLRISSQSMKRAWRTSDVFRDAVGEEPGIRLKQGSFMALVQERLVDEGVALEAAAAAAAQFGNVFEKEADKAKKAEKPKKNARSAGAKASRTPEPTLTEDVAGSDEAGTSTDGTERAAVAEREKRENLTFVSAAELNALLALARRVASGDEVGQDEIRGAVGDVTGSVDIAMYGRMLAGRAEYNVGAAVQVAHAVTTHRAVVEDDFFTGVDEFKQQRNLPGAGHVGLAEFGSGVFYVYLCVDVDQLRRNLGGDVDLAGRCVEALLRAVAEVSPTGKQNSFASRARPLYLLAETGPQQPRNLACAFTEPVKEGDYNAASIRKLVAMTKAMDAVYGSCADDRRHLDVVNGDGTTLNEIAAFCGRYAAS